MRHIIISLMLVSLLVLTGCANMYEQLDNAPEVKDVESFCDNICEELYKDSSYYVYINKEYMNDGYWLLNVVLQQDNDLYYIDEEGMRIESEDVYRIKIKSDMVDDMWEMIQEGSSD